jgi:hypothetical protein
VSSPSPKADFDRAESLVGWAKLVIGLAEGQTRWARSSRRAHADATTWARFALPTLQRASIRSESGPKTAFSSRQSRQGTPTPHVFSRRVRAPGAAHRLPIRGSWLPGRAHGRDERSAPPRSMPRANPVPAAGKSADRPAAPSRCRPVLSFLFGAVELAAVHCSARKFVVPATKVHCSHATANLPASPSSCSVILWQESPKWPEIRKVRC